MSARELAYWMAFDRLYPTGERAHWLRHALAARHLTALHTPKGESVPPLTHFIPDFGADE